MSRLGFYSVSPLLSSLTSGLSLIVRQDRLMTFSRAIRLFHKDAVRRQNSSQRQQINDFVSILSGENKLRSQCKLTKVEPVRTWNDYHLKPDYNYAAVLVPLCTVDGEPSLIFTLRSSRLKKHRGQVSFPGGNVDKSDRDFIHTAFRETEEELGIKESEFDIWGQMKSLPGSGGKKVVYPVLAKTGEIDVTRLRINPDEVEEVFTVSLRHLCDPANCHTTRFNDGGVYTLPVYTGGAHRIWGLTAVIIHQVMNVIAPDLYRFKVKHRRNQYVGNKI